MKKLLFLFTFTVVTLTLMFVLASCACSRCDAQEESTVPEHVKKKADEFIISSTGTEIFNNYISQDFRRTKKIDDGYLMIYRLIIPEKPFVNTVIEFRTDTSGNVIQPETASGIPDCYSGECEFNINQMQAEEIALQNDFEKGINEWKIGFLWNAKNKKYLWHILNTFSESEGAHGYRGNGKEMLIEPSDGTIVSVNEWRVN